MITLFVGMAMATNSEIPVGKSMRYVTARGLPLEVHLHRPKNYRKERIIVVLHGTLRNADEYRDDAVEMGDRFRALIVTPKFDAERFPQPKYQRGGIMKEDGTAAPKEEWTYALLPQILKEIRAVEGKPTMPYWIIGHSAGGQFAMRMAGFFDSGAKRVVAANPGTNLFPTRDQEFGYGFGTLPDSLSNDAALKRYLAQPLTLYLGSMDAGPDEYLDESPRGMAQGPGRFQRGTAAFEYAKALAKKRGWKFGWRRVVAEGVGHDHLKMFNDPACEIALFGKAGTLD